MNPRTAKRVVRAVKIMRKRPRNVKDDSQNERVQSEFEHEVALWRFLKHRYIVPLIAVYDTPFATFCVTPLNVGGTLHDVVRSRRQQYSPNDRGLSAPLAKRYAYQLAAAIRYLHEDARIVHRDIKLENCLLDMTAPDSASQGGNILLCDFGMADYIQVDSRDGHAEAEGEEAHNIGPAASSSILNTGVATRSEQTPSLAADLGNRDTTLTIMGSLEYAAPEVVSATTTLFSPKTDIWAFGVVLYALLTGSLPFSHGMREKLALMIEKSQWDIAPLFSAPAVRGGGLAGMAAVDLVKACLTWDSEDRLGIRDVLEARWFVNCKELYGEGNLGEDELASWGT
jgi:serine/threonine protein kinase